MYLLRCAIRSRHDSTPMPCRSGERPKSNRVHGTLTPASRESCDAEKDDSHCQRTNSALFRIYNGRYRSENQSDSNEFYLKTAYTCLIVLLFLIAALIFTPLRPRTRISNEVAKVRSYPHFARLVPEVPDHCATWCNSLRSIVSWS